MLKRTKEELLPHCPGLIPKCHKQPSTSSGSGQPSWGTCSPTSQHGHQQGVFKKKNELKAK